LLGNVYVSPERRPRAGLQDVKWGEVYYADLPIKENSCVQGGRRPVVVVSNNIGNEYSSAINVIPMTSNLKKLGLPTHVQIDCLSRPSIALCEQLMTIDKNQILDRVGIVPMTVMRQIIDTLYHVQFNGDLRTAC
jgi:mRNA interferase MazF